MSQDREDFRADYGDGSEPERELDDREQADAPEIEDELNLSPKDEIRLITSKLDGLYGRQEVIDGQIDELQRRNEKISDKIIDLEARLEQLEDG